MLLSGHEHEVLVGALGQQPLTRESPPVTGFGELWAAQAGPAASCTLTL